jgi:GDPmannose 4,6-dehydratase
VSDSFENPISAAYESGIFAVELFEACRLSDIKESVRIYQAGSSEMFGSPSQSPQTESTPFHPNSPYGGAKAFAHNMAVQYRENYKLPISNGILYNHEGPYRSSNFVSKKITSSVAEIKRGHIKKFSLGNIEGRRDWGYAGDYVKAMHAMLLADNPDDFIISTGKSYSVRDFLKATLEIAGLNGEIEDYVEIDPALQRPADSTSLVGDNSKAKSILGWTPETSFENLVELMFQYEMDSSPH